jgi:glycosyltransferase involved in cell wall biosynthesis
VVEQLARHAEVHYFGMRTATPVPDLIRRNAQLHYLPWSFNRRSTRDKLFKTVLWYLAMPCMALRCRLMGVDAIFIDETLPLTALIVRVFYGRNLALTVMDFFLDIYFQNSPVLYPLCKAIKAIDFATWRHVPVIFTRVNFTHRFLVEKGVPAERIHTVYNPCDRNVFHPSDRQAARRRFGLREEDLVVVHHGILHPNKGNDVIIRAMAEMKDQLPNLRYLLVGAGPQMGDLQRLAAEVGMSDRVIFAGWLPTESDVNEALNAADIGLVLRIGQYSDNFHLTDTLAHEMACGLPIISANLAGIAEVITDGRTGFLFDPPNMGEFKAKLLRLASDPELRRAFGAASLRLSAEFCDIGRASTGNVQPLLELLGTTA